MLSAEVLRHRGEIAKALRSHKYDYTDSGLRIPSMHADIGGVFETWLNGRDHQVHANLLTLQGRNLILDILTGNEAVVAPWYCALFSGNTTPLSTWTGANFTSLATEFTDYDEATRVEFEQGTAAAGSISNTLAKADFTISAGVTDQNLYGGALLSTAAKSAITGSCLASSLFSGVRIVNATDILTALYTLNLTSS